jgi:hypothetical protein
VPTNSLCGGQGLAKLAGGFAGLKIDNEALAGVDDQGQIALGHLLAAAESATGLAERMGRHMAIFLSGKIDGLIGVLHGKTY